MASFSPSLVLFSLILTLLSIVATATQCQCDANEHMTHLHFYMHDDYTGYTGLKPTAIRIITMPTDNDTSPRSFGDMVALNNILTEGPDHKSEHIGRAQGFAVRVAEGGSISDLSLNFAFERGPHKGSSLSIHGRIQMDSPIRESVVIGGTGHFRFARGYMLSKNYDYNLASGGVVEMDVYVM